MASILDVRKGDIIVERANGKKSMIPVRKVEFFVCSSRGVHVNDNACYDNTAVVTLVDGKGTIGDLRDELESGLGDLPEDGFPLGTVRVSDEGVNEEDMDGVMDEIQRIADLLVKH